MNETLEITHPKDAAWAAYDAMRLRGDVACDRAFRAGWEAALKAARNCQPCTAERPREDAYQHGKFDGVMEYGRAILSLSR